MNIELSKLKQLLKKLSCVKAETIILDTHNGVLCAREGNLSVYVINEILKDPSIIDQVYFFPAKKFLPSVNRMSGTLTIRKTDNYYSLVSNKTRIELDIFEQPWQFDLHLTTDTAIKTSALQNIVQYVQIASDPKQDAMSFAGLISLKGHEDFIDGSRVQAVATDGKRMAVIEEEATSSNLDVLMPTSLVSIIGQLDGELTYIQDSANYVLIHSNGLVAVANKFNGKFPDAVSFFPEIYDFKVTVKPQEFLEALGRIQPMVNEDTRTMGIEYKNGAIVMSTAGSGGTGKDEVPYNGPDREYKGMFDHKFLADFFSTIKDSNEEVTICHKTDKQFLVFQHGEKQYLIANMVSTRK